MPTALSIIGIPGPPHTFAPKAAAAVTPPVTPPVVVLPPVLIVSLLPNYQINVYDPLTGDLLAVFTQTQFMELQYEKLLNDVGKCALTLPYQPGLESIFRLDALIDILRTHPATGTLAKQDTYLVRLTHRYQDEQSDWYTIGGLSLNHLLDRRVIDPDDDPLAAGGYSTKAGPADQVMAAYAREQLGDLASVGRAIPGLTIGPAAGFVTPVGARKRYDNLLTVFRELSEAGRVDFAIERTGGNNLFMRIRRTGTNRTRTTNYPLQPWVGLAPERGNLINPALIRDRKEEKNVVYALGEGDTTNRTVLKISGAGVADSPYNRVEFTQNISTGNKKSPTELYTRGIAALNEKQVTTEFTFELNLAAAGAIYELDWTIGDYVTAFWGDFTKDVRIIGVEVSLQPDREDVKVLLKDAPIGT